MCEHNDPFTLALNVCELADIVKANERNACSLPLHHYVGSAGTCSTGTPDDIVIRCHSMLLSNVYETFNGVFDANEERGDTQVLCSKTY